MVDRLGEGGSHNGLIWCLWFKGLGLRKVLLMQNPAWPYMRTSSEDPTTM